MSEPSLTVKNWRIFQHYKNRSPPWIKLQKSVLDDYDFQCLPLASRALAPMLWLLASESDDGSIPACVARLAFRLRWSEKEVSAGLKPLIEQGFLLSASNMLANPEQLASSEGEGEGEGEHASATVFPEGLDPEAWEAWTGYRTSIRKPLRPASHQAAMKSLAKYGPSQRAVVEQSIANGWTGLFDLKQTQAARPKADPYARAI